MHDSLAPKYSIIIPVYNRPEELNELLSCISSQYFRDFEVIVIEDGSIQKSDEIVKGFSDKINIRYFYKENGGQGFARNYGFEKALGTYFILFDSDALIEPNYLQVVEERMQRENVSLYGGPDTDHPSFTNIQKAISYSMTSFFTTGGIRGKKANLGGQFHPRSFNMGMSREVWLKTNGFLTSRMGEDIIFSIRAIEMGFSTALIPEAFIYHKRRTKFSQFFRQLKFFGRARINIGRYYPKELKLVHMLPMFFTLGLLILPILALTFKPLFYFGLGVYLTYMLFLFWDALQQTKRVKVAFLSIIAAFTQLTGYGLGFMQEGWKRIWEKKSYRETGAAIEYPS